MSYHIPYPNIPNRTNYPSFVSKFCKLNLTVNILEGGPDMLLNAGALDVVLETMVGALDNICKYYTFV